MKILIGFLFVLCLLISCNQHTIENRGDTNLSEQEFEPTTNRDSLLFSNRTNASIQQRLARSQALKKERLLAIVENQATQSNLIESKNIKQDADDYLLDYTYPYLNEQITSNFKQFNDYITENYLNIERTVNEILEDKELLCDTLNIERFRDKRTMDFTVYTNEPTLLSVLLYKENFYSGMLHSTYMFDCLNYDVQKQTFLYFDDFFLPGTQSKVFEMINEYIYERTQRGDAYTDCWEISESDFRAYKNNFVTEEEAIVFYFDDCIICPSHTGQYAVVLPKSEIADLLKNRENAPYFK